MSERGRDFRVAASIVEEVSQRVASLTHEQIERTPEPDRIQEDLDIAQRKLRKLRNAGSEAATPLLAEALTLEARLRSKRTEVMESGLWATKYCKQALSAVEEAIELVPTYAVAYVVMSDILLDLGKRTDAMEALRQAEGVSDDEELSTEVAKQLTRLEEGKRHLHISTRKQLNYLLDFCFGRSILLLMIFAVATYLVSTIFL